MKNIFVCICYLFMTSGFQALELSLDLEPATSPGRQALCAVLTCGEQFTNTPTSPARTISSLSIFRTARESSPAGSGNEREKKTLVDSLTSTRPKITRVSNGITVNGILEAEIATLKVEMINDVDCLAQYSCEVRVTDGLGNEFVQTNHLRQRSQQQETKTDGEGVTSAVILQQLALLQQQMAFMGASVDGKLVAVENRFEQLETRLDTAQTRLEDKVLSLHDQIETRVVDKLCQLENKQPKAGGDDEGVNVTQILDDIKETFTKLKREMKDDNQNALRLDALAIANSTSEMVTAVQGHLDEILTFEQRNHLKLIELSETKDIITNSTEKLGHLLQNNLQALNANFEELKTAVHSSSRETPFTPAVASTNAVVDGSSPKVCRKGTQSSDICHVIQPSVHSELDVPYLCDFVTDGGGWILIQRRVSGALNFYRRWAEYKNGFGSLAEEFWLGNDNIHTLTSSGTYELRVDVEYKGELGYAHYSSFSLGDESHNYVLRLGDYDGTAGDGLGYHNGKPFSTRDRDNDGDRHNRAALYYGGWWYGPGYYSNLNGQWNARGTRAAQWYEFAGQNSVSFSEMKIRKL